MGSWKTKTIREITSLVKDGTHGTHKDHEGGVPLLSAKDISGGVVIIDNAPRLISQDEFKQIHRSYKLQEEDILLTIVGTLGRVAIVENYNDSYTFQRSVAILRFKNDVNPRYMYYALNGCMFQKELLKRESKGAQGGVYLGEISKIHLTIPEKPEQQRIVVVLKVWDEYLELLDQKIALKERLKKGLMQQLLSGKKRLPGFTENWMDVKLGDISTIKTGGKDNQDKIVSGEYPFYVRSPRVERINTFSFEGEAILVPGEGNIGKIFHYINGRFDYHQRVYGITHFHEGVSGRYVYYYFVKNFARQAGKHSVKATVDSLRLPTFTNFCINLPEYSEQLACVNLLDTASTEIINLKLKRTRILNQKQFLLKNLISGTIRTPENLHIKGAS